MEGPPLGPGGEDITWPDQVAPRGRKASSTRKIKPQTSNPTYVLHLGRLERLRALLPKWAHENMENSKIHTLLPTHRFGFTTQASLHEG